MLQKNYTQIVFILKKIQDTAPNINEREKRWKTA